MNQELIDMARQAGITMSSQYGAQWEANTEDLEAFAALVAAALAQPAQEPWCMKMNRCTTKCEDCPDEPAQEPVSVTYKEVADAMNSLWNGTLEQHQIAEQMANKKLYTAPQQRPWMGLTDEDQFNLVHAMNKNDWHAIQMMDAIEAKLKEKNG